MTEQQIPPASKSNEDSARPTAPPKRKASWFRTILWMLAMMLLANVVMAIVAYFLYFYKK